MKELVLDCVAAAASALAHAVDQATSAEVAQCVAIAALCDLHQVDDTILVEGAERWVPGGADGTPTIGEFVAAEIAALLGVSPGAAFDRIARVLNLRHRHPTLWQLVLSGDMRAYEGFWVADAASTAKLDAAACGRFDRMCAHALRLQPWRRVRGQVDRWLLLADPAQAARNTAAAAQRRHVTVDPIVDGHTRLYGQLDAADGVALDDALTHLAAHIDGESVDHRRATALGLMARGVLGQDVLPATTGSATGGCSSITTGGPSAGAGPAVPGDVAASGASTVVGKGGAPVVRKVDLVVRLNADDLADPQGSVASVGRWGHVLLPTLGNLLSGCTVTIRPIVMGSDLPAVDGYQVPDSMRLALAERNPVDVFPWGTRPAGSCQADHTIAYQAGVPGQTHLGNLGPLSSFTHRVKTHGGWKLEQPEAGRYHWRSPLGYEYEVTPAGTIRINRPPPAVYQWWNREPPDDPNSEPPDPGLIDGPSAGGESGPGDRDCHQPAVPEPEQAPLPHIA